MREKLKNDLLLLLNTYVDTEVLRGIDQRLDIILSDYEIESRKTEIITYEYQIPETVEIYIVSKKIAGLSDKTLSDDIKQFSYEICSRHNVIIHEMETDKDHIHYMIETEPNINLSNLVRTMKSYTTYHIWKLHNKCLSKHFWKEHTFWTDGYFICSIGNVSEKQLRKYIENQG